METLPRITIITPSYNQGHFIEQTINSILGQNYPDLEYIVMDGGSTDSTLEILEKYERRLLWISERDRGQSHAINKGVAMATGEIVAFLNSDDLYEPGALLKVGKFFAAHPEACWLTGRCRTIDSRGKEIRKAITLYKNVWLRTKSYRVLLVLDYISQPATFWSRRAIDAVGEFDESLRYAMDYDYSLRVGRSFKLWVLDDYLASFRVHPSSKAGSSAHAQFDTDFQIAKRYITSPLLVGLHAAHNAFTVNVYRVIMSSNQLAMHLKVLGTK
jgi:glycosyltransferase involved in cell wall biosynthesis